MLYLNIIVFVLSNRCKFQIQKRTDVARCSFHCVAIKFWGNLEIYDQSCHWLKNRKECFLGVDSRRRGREQCVTMPNDDCKWPLISAPLLKLVRWVMFHFSVYKQYQRKEVEGRNLYFFTLIIEMQDSPGWWSQGVTPWYGLYRYVQLQRVWFFSRFGNKLGIDFSQFATILVINRVSIFAL